MNTLIATDAVYGVGDVEGTLRRASKGYALGVKSDKSRMANHDLGKRVGRGQEPWERTLPLRQPDEQRSYNDSPVLQRFCRIFSTQKV